MEEYQQIYKDSLFMMLYGGATVLAILACVYLLFRRSNAFAPEITPPMPLRHWVAAFFALMALSHAWWLLFVGYQLLGDPWKNLIVACGLDYTMLVPVMLAMLLVMLQDRRRPLWPTAVVMLPVVVILAVFYFHRSESFVLIMQAYFLMLVIAFIIKMVCALRQYDRWLCDNYADLEHKEVWQSIAAIIVCMFFFGYYLSGHTGTLFEYILQVNDIVIIGLLLWRVETLSDLSDTLRGSEFFRGSEGAGARGCEICLNSEYSRTPVPPYPRTPESPRTPDKNDDFALLLQKHCVDTQLYLQHGIRLDDLCRAIGTNRSYLGQYFAQQDTTYNAYINNLRIRHFVRLYREAIATGRPFTAQQLAWESGFRSYSTFGTAFKQQMGQTVTVWMRDTAQ